MIQKDRILWDYLNDKSNKNLDNILFLETKNSYCSYEQIRNMVVESLEKLESLEDKFKEKKTKILREALLTADLYTAIEDRTLEVYYQPLINLQTNEIIGSEALLRWNHPQLGLISPLEFIPLAEETELIYSIGEWVLREACLQIQEWSLMCDRPLKISVNLSSHQFKKNNLPLEIKNILKEISFNPELLNLELVESTFINDFNQAQEKLRNLKKLKISVVLDDFGTGYSSLSYLDKLPLDGIKIDKSFMRDIAHNHQKLAIVKGIISICKALNLKVTAEGLETKADVDCMNQEKCNWGQGYFFSKPIPRQQFESLLLQLTRPRKSIKL